jgi:hypothetical protein
LPYTLPLVEALLVQKESWDDDWKVFFIYFVLTSLRRVVSTFTTASLVSIMGDTSTLIVKMVLVMLPLS